MLVCASTGAARASPASSASAAAHARGPRPDRARHAVRAVREAAPHRTAAGLSSRAERVEGREWRPRPASVACPEPFDRLRTGFVEGARPMASGPPCECGRQPVLGPRLSSNDAKRLANAKAADLLSGAPVALCTFASSLQAGCRRGAIHNRLCPCQPLWLGRQPRASPSPRMSDDPLQGLDDDLTPNLTFEGLAGSPVPPQPRCRADHPVGGPGPFGGALHGLPALRQPGKETVRRSRPRAEARHHRRQGPLPGVGGNGG